MALALGIKLRGGRLLPAAALFLLLATTPAAAEQTTNTVTVREEQGVYTVVAEFVVDQPAAIARAVLTDYERIPRFIRSVRTSIVRERTATRAVVEQEAVSAVMMFSKRIHLVLDVDEGENNLTFRDRCGRSFLRYEGAWTLSPHGDQTAVTYQLTAAPAFDVPGFVLKRLLKRDSTAMIELLQSEVIARGAAAGATNARP